jgi:low temperature requirement protein LtrA
VTGQQAATTGPDGHEIERVSTLELFFDLVFVLTITQITALVVHHPTAGGVVRAAVLLAVIFYMYGGYAWLTNAVAADRVRRRLTLLLGMACFLVIALAVPVAFEDGRGIALGLAYVAVIVIHAVLFARSAPVASAAIRTVLPINLVAGLLVLAGTAVGGTSGVWLMASSLLVSWGVSIFRSARAGFDIGAEHFVERHGLVVIVAIGESIVAIGVGAEGLSLSPELLVTAVLGLVVSAGLWWTYFGGDDERAVTSLAAFPVERRGVIALRAFGYWHVVMLLGIILFAAGLKKTLGHPLDPASTAAAVFLAAGVALFLLGETLFRHTLGIGRGGARAVAATACLVAIPVATEAGGLVALAVLVLILGGLFAAEGRSAAGARSA